MPAMFTELWQNKSNIFNNFTSILYSNRVGLSVIILLLGLIITYAYMRYQEFSHRWNQDQYCSPEIVNINEGFVSSQVMDNTANTRYSFINPGSQASKALYTTILQTYLAGFNQPNIQARGFDTKAELERTYRTMLVPITPAEESHITSKLANILDKIPVTKLDKVSSWISQSSIAKGAKWLESGMPHTHANTMIMNANWFANPACSTYFHELFHIIQRNIPEPFHQLYTKAWNFIKVAGGPNPIPGLETQITLARMNPDANDFSWIWHDVTTDKYYWINAIFTQSAPTSLLAVQYLAYPLDGRTFRYLGSQPIELKSLASFVNMFGIGYNHYHPNEIASQYAEYYFASAPEPQEIKNKPAYLAFTNWLDKLAKL